MHRDVFLSTGFRIGLRRADGQLSDICVDARWSQTFMGVGST